MKKSYLMLAFLIMASATLSAQWTTITTDPTGDGSNSVFLDATKLEYQYDADSDSIWFKFTTAGINNMQSRDFGINIMVNYTGGGSTFNFWGAQNTDSYHRLLSVWVTGMPPRSYNGTIGIADASGVQASNFTNLSRNNLQIFVNAGASTINIGVKRSDLIPNSALNTSIKVAGAVGASNGWNDDVYSSTAAITLGTSSTTDIHASSLDESIQLYPNPTNSILHFGGNLPAKSTITLIHSNGQQVENMPIETEQLDISDFLPGVYHVLIRDESGNIIYSSNIIKS